LKSEQKQIVTSIPANFAEQPQPALASRSQAPTAESRGRIAAFFRRWPANLISHYLLIGFCIWSCMSIALSQIFLISSLVIWAATVAGLIPGSRSYVDGEISFKPERTLALLLLGWFGVSLVSAFVGIDPARAIPETLKSSIFLLLPFSVVSSLRRAALSDAQLVRRLLTYLTALAISQGIAAVHTVVSGAIGYEFAPHGPGAMTESGQALLTIHCFISACFIASLDHDPKDRQKIDLLGLKLTPAVLGVLILMLLLFLAWPEITGIPKSYAGAAQLGASAIVVTLLCSLFLPGIFRRDKATGQSLLPAFYTVVGAFLIAAFIINLKRGPWLGFGSSLLILGVFLARKRLIAAAVCGTLVLFALGPAKQRIMNFTADYEINGGRKNMWELGMELTERYPLGLGLGNASYMRIIDPSLPPQHRHMHNNLLNVAVETGLIGLMAYISWMVFLILLGIRIWNGAKCDKRRQVHSLALCALSISCALLGWQVAGTVEYNFGDGEIRMIAMLLMGLGITAAGRLMHRLPELRLAGKKD
jgi:hypothetical protein